MLGLGRSVVGRCSHYMAWIDLLDVGLYASKSYGNHPEKGKGAAVTAAVAAQIHLAVDAAIVGTAAAPARIDHTAV